MHVRIHPSWQAVLQQEFDKPYFAQLAQTVRAEYAAGTCYPPGRLIFNAFNLCPLSEVKVVIIGQDPYHEPRQAHGLCFSVNDDVPLPPSLLNIYKEIQAETGAPIPATGNLTRWAQQGVLLLNATLTVRAHQANSHAHIGWQQFTDAVIDTVNAHTAHTVFMLWGGFARSKARRIDAHRHLVLQAAHPSPLSANRGGWFGNRHFNTCNAYLTQHGKAPIQW
ncbi:MAG: uracil-DNA glycosylase [Bacteroidaceae bacterium]|nr:uracil-DNA glycosylase [Bacteroidaceae bacterium]